jgi:SNF2 family DNA or RNA helicase
MAVAEMTEREDEKEQEDSELTLNMLQAQEIAEAEIEVEEATYQEELGASSILPIVPKLLQSYQNGVTPDVSKLAAKTQELKAKGQQLDLLLLKAEAYSHFIRENQERCRQNIDSGVSYSAKDLSIGASRKRKSSETESSATDAAAPNNTPAFKVTSSLVGGTLLPYQVDGLKWLLSLWENGLSGILADEMGLGKTIQIIALIAQLRSSGTTGPFLIAGPLSVLTNWIHEFQKWLPTCPVVLYHGSKQERQQIRQSRMLLKSAKSLAFPIVITSFEICMIDRRFLEKYQWQYIILDEGHRIKNRNCKLVRELKQIPSISRLLLTGTPIQNTLEELWSLLNFVNPQIFDNLEVFQAWFGFRNIGKDTQVDEIVDSEQETRVVSKLHEILRPFLLRRMKRDVLIDMPDKREVSPTLPPPLRTSSLSTDRVVLPPHPSAVGVLQVCAQQSTPRDSALLLSGGQCPRQPRQSSHAAAQSVQPPLPLRRAPRPRHRAVPDRHQPRPPLPRLGQVQAFGSSVAPPV